MISMQMKQIDENKIKPIVMLQISSIIRSSTHVIKGDDNNNYPEEMNKMIIANEFNIPDIINLY